MRILIICLFISIASQAVGECKNLCNEEWWKKASLTDVKKELRAGADVMARDKEESTPLHHASMYGTDDMIQALITAGADIGAKNECDSTPLHFAASRGTTQNIQALLNSGADIMAQEADGWTPLHRATSCSECNPGNIQVLLTAGASVMVEDEEGITPWDLAQQNKKLKGTPGYFIIKDARFK